MTEPLLRDFLNDLNQAQNVLRLLCATKNLLALDQKVLQDKTGLDDLVATIDTVRATHSAFPTMYGGLYVVVAGRFESYVKNVIEDLAVRVAQKTKAFDDLPRDMRDNLTMLTGRALHSPKKFRMEKFVQVMVSNLSRNMGSPSDLTAINQYCLTITEENMRASTVDELFRRLGIKDIWERIAQNPQIQTFLGTYDSNKARAECEAELNQLMEQRNQFAHPSASTTWPSEDQITRIVEFLEKVAAAISTQVPVCEGRLTKSASA